MKYIGTLSCFVFLLFMSGCTRYEIQYLSPSVQKELGVTYFKVAQPHYPSAALREHITGCLLMQFTRGPDGYPVNIKILASNPHEVFDKMGIQALKKTNFPEPKGKDRKVNYTATLEYVFAFDKYEAAAAIKPCEEYKKYLANHTTSKTKT